MHHRKQYTYLRYPSILLCAIIVIGMAWLWGKGVIVDREVQDDINAEFGFWTIDTTFEQSFLAMENNLCRLDVYIHSYHPWDNPFLECRLFEILHSDAAVKLSYQDMLKNLREVRQQRLYGWLISPHMFNAFSFAPIPDSQGKSYLLRIRAPQLKRGGTSILKASPQERYERGELFVDGDPKKGDLAFRILYQQPRRRVMQESAARLALMKPFPFSHPIAYYLLGVGYLVLIFTFFWRAVVCIRR